MEATVVDSGPLPLRSSLEGMGRVVRTISMLWEASFSLKGSLGAAEGRWASWATSLVVSATFLASSDCSTALGEMLAVGRALVGFSLPSSASLETESALELKEPEAQMAEG